MTKKEIKKIERIKNQLENLQGKLYDFSYQHNLDNNNFEDNDIDKGAFELDTAILKLESWLRDNKK